jgi:hypothetical protein
LKPPISSDEENKNKLMNDFSRNEIEQQMYQTMLTHTFESSTSEYHRSSVNEEEEGSCSESSQEQKTKKRKRKKNRL